MSFLKSIPAFIFAIIAGLLIVLSLIIVSPIYAIIFAIGGKHANQTATKLSRIWAWYVLFCSGTRIKVYGQNLIDQSQTYVFISNHRSYLDIPVSARSTKNIFKFLAKDELGHVPLLGYIIRKLYITVRRQSMRDRVLSLRKMEVELNKGISVWLYPEGTRNKTDKPLTDFNDGAFTVAINTGKPIAFCTIFDTGKILRPGKLFQLFPGKVDVWWEQPIETKGLSKKDIPLLKERVRNMMVNRIKAFGVRE
jgi:1-acyl-sn-glycerol-3-phosphate acyltransferase